MERGRKKVRAMDEGASAVDPGSSHLSNDKWGYDFVVATTAGSINAGLKEYLDRSDQPVSSYYFGADHKGHPGTLLTEAQVLEATGGVDPFSIPNDSYADHADLMEALMKIRFQVGVRIQAGLPDDVSLDELAPIVDFTQGTAKSVAFNLYCKQAAVVELEPPSRYADEGSWAMWRQGEGENIDPWRITASVDLDLEDLDQELDTKYFQEHPEERAVLHDKLKDMSASAFSLQQLLFYLDNATVEEVSKQVFVGTLVVSTLAIAGLQAAEAAVVAVDDGDDDDEGDDEGDDKQNKPEKDKGKDLALLKIGNKANGFLK